MRRFWILAVMLLAPAAMAELPVHPLASSGGSNSLLPDGGFLDWGPTTLGYSTAWSGGQSYSQGFMHKQVSADLLPGLSFKAHFGVSYQPGARLNDSGQGSRLEIPEATLTWRPSENFLMRLQWRQGSLGSPYSRDPWLNPWESGGWDDPLLPAEVLNP